MVIKMTRSEYEAKYGVAPVTPPVSSAPVKMTQLEYDKKYNQNKKVGFHIPEIKETIQDFKQTYRGIRNTVREGRNQSIDIAKKSLSGEQTSLEGGIQFAGKQVQTTGRVVGELFKGGVKALLIAENEEKVKNFLSNTIERYVGINKGNVGQGIDELKERYSVFKEKYPRLSRTLEATAQIAEGVIDVATGRKGGEILEKTFENRPKVNFKQAATEVGDTVSGAVDDLAVGIGNKTKGFSDSNKVSSGIMNRVARLNPSDSIKFKNIAGETHGEYLVKNNNISNPEKIITNEAEKFFKSYKGVDDGLAQLKGRYKNGGVSDALDLIIEKGYKTSGENIKAPFLERALQLQKENTYLGLDMSEINEVKRLLERKVKLGYNKLNNPDRIELATNIDDSIRDWQIGKAEELGFTNLKALNKQTQISKFLSDKLGDKITGPIGNNGLSLTDAVLLAGGDAASVAGYLTKKFFGSKAVQTRVAKIFSGKKNKGDIKPDFKSTDENLRQGKKPLQLPAGNTKRIPITAGGTDFLGNKIDDAGKRISPKQSKLEVIPAEKNPVSVNPKTGRFQTTYSSSPIIKNTKKQSLLSEEKGKSTYKNILPKKKAKVNEELAKKIAKVELVKKDAPKGMFNKSNKEVFEVADNYVTESKIGKNDTKIITKISKKNSKVIADAYDKLKDNPKGPKVIKAYNALIKETIGQYRAMEKAGYKIEPFPNGADPYKNSAEMSKDILENKHLYYFPTTKESLGASASSSHPYLKATGIKINGKETPFNDLFRAVHDFFGHSKVGNGFGAIGEENAWLQHSVMYSDDARRAMTTETRGQNSWVNFGKQLRDKNGKLIKKGEEGYIAPPDREYAPQKTALLPDKFVFPERASSSKKTSIFEKIKKRIKDTPNKQGGFVKTGFSKDSDLIADAKKFDTVEEFIENYKLSKVLRGTRGLSADDIAKTYPDIQLKVDVRAKDVAGNKVVIPEGEALTPYELKDGKILLQDGVTYTVTKNQFANIKGNSVSSEAIDFNPELKGTEETVKGKESVKQRDLTSIEKEELSNLIEEGRKTSGFYNTEEGLRAIELQKIAGTYKTTDMETKYTSYQLPGGKDYQEVLIQAPVKKDSVFPARDAKKKLKEKGITFEEEMDNTVFPVKDGEAVDYDEMSKEVQNLLDVALGDSTDISGFNNVDKAIFKSSHWEEPNVISHLRLNNRTYKNEPVTFMEELQSDWASDGRKKGFTSNPEEITKVIDNVKKYDVPKDEGDWSVKVLENSGVPKELADKWYGFEIAGTDTIPNNPLLKNWQEMTTKRALQEAVSNKSEYFAWINGTQTSARYNLATQLDNVEWKTAGNPKNLEKQITMKVNSGGTQNIGINEKGQVTFATQQNWEGKSLDEVIGKGLADKIMADETGILAGEGLQFGGEWAINLYDKQVGNIVKDLTGAKVIDMDMGLPVVKKEVAGGTGTNNWVRGSVGNMSLSISDVTVGSSIRKAGGFGDEFVIIKVLNDSKTKFTVMPLESIEKIAKIKKIDSENMWTPAYKTMLKDNNIIEELQANRFSEDIDISDSFKAQPKQYQQGIKLTPEIIAKIKGQGAKIKPTSGKKFDMELDDKELLDIFNKSKRKNLLPKKK